ncbi:unnamed protein product, partial [Prorocentrum cordatum]
MAHQGGRPRAMAALGGARPGLETRGAPWDLVRAAERPLRLPWESGPQQSDDCFSASSPEDGRLWKGDPELGSHRWHCDFVEDAQEDAVPRHPLPFAWWSAGPLCSWCAGHGAGRHAVPFPGRPPEEGALHADGVAALGVHARAE